MNFQQKVFFYDIAVKRGWKVAIVGLVDDCPFMGSNGLKNHFCLIRDTNALALESLNELVFNKSIRELRFGIPLRGIFEWNSKEAEAMQKLIHVMETLIKSHDELDKLLEKGQRVALDSIDSWKVWRF